MDSRGIVTRRQPSYEPPPRVFSEHQLATLFGMGETKFRAMRPQLEAEGFPKQDDLLGGTDAAAAHRWLDRRSGLATADADQELNNWQP